MASVMGASMVIVPTFSTEPLGPTDFEKYTDAELGAMTLASSLRAVHGSWRLPFWSSADGYLAKVAACHCAYAWGLVGGAPRSGQ